MEKDLNVPDMQHGMWLSWTYLGDSYLVVVKYRKTIIIFLLHYAALHQVDLWLLVYVTVITQDTLNMSCILSTLKFIHEILLLMPHLINIWLFFIFDGLVSLKMLQGTVLHKDICLQYREQEWLLDVSVVNGKQTSDFQVGTYIFYMQCDFTFVFVCSHL